ncbi:LysR family transcriptional regulator [Pseudomonas fluorescens]|uniref:LysR family transcriptional regulator n=1 Tax=Pseudomonas fluorescens TaxID=294 RepID=A0A327NC55_PSEFL|nr:LysR family transcriptional regulator [Pseudomonas fluorescens]RAI72515.1 LysR family transcriptional regulator [Pseudomonas fluorescens]
MHNWDWDDLRLILAVAEHKSFAAAARLLNVNHTTVLRRVNTFEQEHGLRIFNRLSTGYTLTEAGEELLQTAEIMRGAVSDLALRLEGKDLKLEGTLRITTCDTIMGSVLPEILEKFSKLHTKIVVELATGNFVTDLAQRHADVAIRTGDNPSESLIGRHLADVRFALYASDEIARQVEGTDPLGFSNWISPDTTFSQMAITKWIQSSIPASSIIFKANSLISLRQAAIAGMGIVPLPRYLGDNTIGLTRLTSQALDQFTTGLWILTHQDLRHTARVREFISFVSDELRQHSF